MSSGDKINYTLRTAKNIERKMISEILQRLSSSFDIFTDYRYVGFGSFYFSDFILFHKVLGITNMISIEGNNKEKERFEFNKPYEFIDIIFDQSNKVLPSLWAGYSSNTICWLDYDFILKKNTLIDIETFTANAKSGDMLFVTYKLDLTDPAGIKTRMEYLETHLKEYKTFIPNKFITKPALLSHSNNIAILFRDIVDKVLTNKIKFSEKLFQQVVFFKYKDNAPMMTLGYIFLDKEKQTIKMFNQCGINNLDFYRNYKDFYDIKIPNITLKEQILLDSLLPKYSYKTKKEKHLACIGNIEGYRKIYKYYPSYVEGFK